MPQINISRNIQTQNYTDSFNEQIKSSLKNHKMTILTGAGFLLGGGALFAGLNTAGVKAGSAAIVSTISSFAGMGAFLTAKHVQTNPPTIDKPQMAKAQISKLKPTLRFNNQQRVSSRQAWYKNPQTIGVLLFATSALVSVIAYKYLFNSTLLNLSTASLL